VRSVGERATPIYRAAGEKFPASGKSRDLLSGVGIGHPVHPMLVNVPLGCWTSAVLLDLLGPGRLTARARSSRRLVAWGLLATVPAAATGLSDWRDTEGDEQNVGAAHASLNSVAWACFAISWWKRRQGGHAGMGWSWVGLAAASAAGWLGGELSYGMGVGIDTNAFETGPSEFQPAVAVDGALPASSGSASDGAAGNGPAPLELALVKAGGVRLVAADISGTTRVLADRCSHRGGPLSDGHVEGGCIVCPWHNSAFDAETGAAVRGPATVAQPAYESRMSGDVLEVRRKESRALRQRSVR